MTKKKNFLISTLLFSVIGLSSFVYYYSGSEKQVISAQEAVKGYLIDKNQQIPLYETSIARNLSLPAKAETKIVIEDDEHNNAENEIAHDMSGELPTHNMADYFRFLQTELAQGNSPSERTESIREHLLSTLPSDKAGELIDLYEKFTNFEYDAVTKAEEWRMPESADETLELIAAMQQYQQEYFGADTANMLFGAEMKVMEYNARRAIILNDLYSAGTDKEQLLDRLGIDMWGEEAYRAMNESKDPYDILDEKLLVYGNELAAVDPDTRQEEIRKLREIYLPPGY